MSRIERQSETSETTVVDDPVVVTATAGGDVARLVP